jgi:HD-GYP domain-containing protein (c-di-GMP phosphodiesterase class II)
MEQAQSLGVYDFITKPFNPEKLFFLVRKGIERHILLVSHRRLVGILKEQNSSLQRQNILLARRIEESAKNLSRLYEDLRAYIFAYYKGPCAGYRRPGSLYTRSFRECRKYSVAIGHQMGLSIKEIEMIRDAAELHDLGKIGIEDAVLMKPAALSSDEWQLVKLHPQMGAQILEPLTFLSDVVEMVRQHHEHYDGTGYPAGRRAEEILIGARIIHLADAFDAMTSARSYRKTPLSRDQAVNEIRKHSNTQFDPKVVDAFCRSFTNCRRIYAAIPVYR